jgi:hypothetical protein
MHDEMAAVRKWVRKHWARSLPPIFALVVGVVAGVYVTEGRILDDCKYSSSFRIGSQSFNCGRRI